MAKDGFSLQITKREPGCTWFVQADKISGPEKSSVLMKG